MNMRIHLVVDAEGTVINRIVLDENTPDNWTPGPGLRLLPHSVEGAIGGTYINGVYAAPPQTESEEGEK